MSLVFDLDAFVREAGDAIIAADDAIGELLALIIPNRFRQRHWDAYRESMASGKTKYGKDVLRVPAVGKDALHRRCAEVVDWRHRVGRRHCPRRNHTLERRA